MCRMFIYTMVFELCMIKKERKKDNKIEIFMFALLSFSLGSQNSWGIFYNSRVKAFVYVLSHFAVVITELLQYLKYKQPL